MTRADALKSCSREQNIEGLLRGYSTGARPLLSAVKKLTVGRPGDVRSHSRWRAAQMRAKLTEVSPGTALGCVTQAAVFRGLSPQEHAEIAAAAQQCDLPRRTTIFREDEAVRSVLVIASGRVKTTQVSRVGKEVIMRVEGPGEVIGGAGLAPGTKHFMSAQSIEPCQIFSWELGDFDVFADRFVRLRRNTVEILSERLRMLQERFRDMATERVPQRLARLLLGLSTQSTNTSEGAAIDLSCEELAQMSGTTLFTVSRLLCEWAEQGIIEPERKAVIVENLPALVQIAGEDVEYA